MTDLELSPSPSPIHRCSSPLSTMEQTYTELTHTLKYILNHLKMTHSIVHDVNAIQSLHSTVQGMMIKESVRLG